MAVVAPVVIVSLGEALVGLLAALIAIGLTLLVVPFVRALLGPLARLLRHVPFVGGRIGGAVAHAEHVTIEWVSHTAGSMESAAARFFHGSLSLWQMLGTTVEALAHSVYVGLTHTAPRALGRIVRRVERDAIRAERRIATAAKWLGLAGIVGSVKASRAYVRRLWHWLAHVAHAVAVDIPHSLHGLRRRVGTIEHRFPRINTRIGHLERLLAPAAIAAAVSFALARLGLGWLRCSNVKNAGRQVCGMDSSLLESLIADTLGILGIISVVEFANELRVVETEALSILHALIREFPAA